ncbi:MAG: VOC family protein [Alphaproteobacteria bacterium]|nr:VOC family protein [Alphaproteobacteria bacterium]
MDAPNPSATPTFANRTPLRIGAVGLIARDLELLTNYYTQLLKLTVMERTGRFVRLGTGGVMLLELEHRPDARPDDPSEAGLYHTAFLMPTRADLARWILHVAKARVPITGASDHDVSEAIYLDDPEGNGIEVYSDRQADQWRREGKTIFQKTDPLDIDAIIREVDPTTAAYPAAPEGLRVGHIHLRVGDTAEAERFYCGGLGMEVTRQRTGATFISSGGYHHHVGANVWHSHGARKRDNNRAGLAWFSVEAENAAMFDATRSAIAATGAPVGAIDGGIETADPWGTRMRLLTA